MLNKWEICFEFKNRIVPMLTSSVVRWVMIVAIVIVVIAVFAKSACVALNTVRKKDDPDFINIQYDAAVDVATFQIFSAYLISLAVIGIIGTFLVQYMKK